ncbi:vanadium-dependent haloperoxidase [Streptomyces sp. MP131-18]|uniref:vanadium-dependent haloperoxidase n=1 Tax=Streptomyces sp. MP131-18 TaxID=1857892 RepID=UPI0009CB1445|nr:vanadium-dependent haloperoxidase [Streptomyces sp. MP131-18]ONK11452.1 PAP2 superfamily protein [Streptomyces sp. MP131-18]
MRTTLRSALLAPALSLLTAVTVLAPVPVAAAAGDEPRVDVALEWYDVTAETLTAPGLLQVVNNRGWSIGWTAATRALHTTPTAGSPDTYRQAALAGAVHASLRELAPDRAEALDAALERTLRQLPDGPAEDGGLAAGRDEAAAMLDERRDDGLDPSSINPPFPAPPPAPGVWQPTPPDYLTGSLSGLRHARPFLLDAADQFRPPPPPALGSPRYRADLAEVRDYGSADSTVRTPLQTETAAFWYGSAYAMHIEPLRVALERLDAPLAERAALVALHHVALVDAQIATSDAKYHYLTWRPVTALRAGGDTDWTPLHVTPAGPDYTSGHSGYTSTADRVLTALTGPRTAPFELTSPTAPGVTRTYTAWRQLTREVVDARVWSGIHTRTADEAGARLGRDIADHTLRHAGELFRRP